MWQRLIGMAALLLWVSAMTCWAGFDDGAQASQRGDYATALREWQPLAEQGHAAAQFNLGMMYAQGQGVPQDYAQVVVWSRRAADQGHAGAQFTLGMMYAQGQGVPQDYAQVVVWYRRAADQGHAGAQNNLGGRYHNGQGVPQDYAKAYFWYNLSAAHLPPGADRERVVRNRDLVAARLTPTHLADAQASAHTWQPTPETPSPPSAPAPDVVVPVRGIPPGRSPPASPRRELIRQVQERLQTMGFNPGAMDGVIGVQTAYALRWFQNTKGFPPTGEPDEQTLDALGVR